MLMIIKTNMNSTLSASVEIIIHRESDDKIGNLHKLNERKD